MLKHDDAWSPDTDTYICSYHIRIYVYNILVCLYLHINLHIYSTITNMIPGGVYLCRNS